MASPSKAPSTEELEVGGQSSDHLFQRSDASVTVNLPNHSCHLGDTVPPKRVEALPPVSRLERELTLSVARSFQNHLFGARKTSTTAKTQGPVTTGRQWPRASDYFTQSDDPKSASAMVQASNPIPSDISGDAFLASVSECQLAHRGQSEISSSAPLNHSRDGTAITENQQIASQFLRGLVALINEIRHDNVPAVSTSPAPRPDITMQPVTALPIRQNTQDITDPTHERPHTAKGPAGYDEQVHHLDVLEQARIARIARLALKDKFEGEVLESSTHDARPMKAPSAQNEQLHHLKALESARIARLALKAKFENEASESSTHDGVQPKASVSRRGNGQLQGHDKLQATIPPGPTITKESRDVMSATPYLLESTTDGKIRLYLNTITNGCTPGRLLYQTGKSDSDGLTQLGTSETAPRVKASMVDFVIERTLDNYKLLVEAYYHLRLRKAQLAQEWKRRNPTRAVSVVMLPYEIDPQHGPPGRYKEVPTTLSGLWRALQEDLEPGEITEGSLCARRLYFVRGRTVYPDFSCRAEEPTYITASEGAHVEKVKKPGRAIVLPESEELYARLAWFVRHVSAKRWKALPQSRKRACEDALVAPGPAKKAKTAEAPDCSLGAKVPGVMTKDLSAVLRQTAVVVLVNDG